MADCNHNYTVYNECRVMADEYSGTILYDSHQQHSVTSCDVTPFQTLFFPATSNFASSLTQQHCLLLLLLMELTEHRTKCTVQQPFTLPTDSVQWNVQWTLCSVGAAD